MEKIFNNPAELESLVKQKFGFPDFIMMENAALAMKKLIEQVGCKKCIILCGKGNNGGDGYALARLLYEQCEPLLFCLEEPTAPEAKVQYEMCRNIGINFISQTALLKLLKTPQDKTPKLIIVDCLFGTGFKGQLPSQAAKIIQAANNSNATRIACDIPSGLAFNADYTVTMGEHKLALFSDTAKQACGQIITAPLGISPELFQNQTKPAAYLITDEDIKLPLRKNKAAHKGTYGHTAVFAGKKAGAAIICANAAMNFGSGLTSLVPTSQANLKQFKISPELMISEPSKKQKSPVPAKTSCIVYGPGIEDVTEQDFFTIASWFNTTDTRFPAAVFDAGVFGCEFFPKLLRALDQKPDARIVLTPHLLELTRFCQTLTGFPKTEVKELAENPEAKIKIAKKINSLFPNTCLVIKSANTFIAFKGQIYIIAQDCPGLAKGGSGDVLAGMIAALLSQGYSAQDAAITACQAHALAAKKIGAGSYSLTPMKLINAIAGLTLPL